MRGPSTKGPSTAKPPASAPGEDDVLRRYRLGGADGDAGATADDKVRISGRIERDARECVLEVETIRSP